MTVALVLLAAIMATIIWWLARQTVHVRPWEASAPSPSFDGSMTSAPPSGVNSVDSVGEPGSLAMSTRKVGLGLFLCVATSLFGLLTSAYYMRMSYPDWMSLPLPRVLWLNTAMLVACCVVMHRTRAAARDNRFADARSGLTLGGALTVAFLVGQLIAWAQLDRAGLTVASNPANAFFYLFTAVHGLHLLGGLWVWGRAGLDAARRVDERIADAPALVSRIELCTVYWNYLLGVWLVVLATLASG